MASDVLQLTRIVEHKTKAWDRSDLTDFAYKASGPLWVFAHHVQAVGSFRAPFEVTEEQIEDRDVTELYLAGRPEPLYVAEPLDAVVQLLTATT